MAQIGKYDALRDRLAGAPTPLELTFDAIDALVGGLPSSALIHRAWWANEEHGQHVQARAWREANRRVESVDLVRRRVTFGPR